MLITFYGVRGSIAAPGPVTAKYGGNTSCVHIRTRAGVNLIFDAGTGIRKLGMQMSGVTEPIFLLLSHGHSDHIQGFPYFDPIYQPDRVINICQGVEGNAAALTNLVEQMDGSNFPVRSQDLPSVLNIVDDPGGCAETQSLSIKRIDLNHPGGGHAYRLEEDGVSVGYITDNELTPPGKPATSYAEWVDFCHGLDLLIHDAQYDEHDMPHKHGWGHSLISQVRQLAVDAQVRNLVMFHHDPMRTDSMLDEIAIENARYFKSKNARIGAWIAAEGLTIELKKRADPKVSTIDLFTQN
ncbi:MAG: MBL fold metallo-hydrolase [Pseudomonadales bacterium]|nr:MBL fold metallo-hydrolase [Pseudomonadales bacterium]